MSYVLGLDLGTGSIKGLLVNQSGKVIVSQAQGYPLKTLKAGFSEQSPKDWLLAVDDLLAKLINEVPDIIDQLEGISISGQMHSLVLIDKSGEVLRDAILWNDVRTTKQCQRITEEMGEKLLKITKNIALEGFTLPKILWIQENEPEIWARAQHFMLPKDYLSYYLTNNIQIDYSDAAGTLLLDIDQGYWSKEIMTAYDLSDDFMPKLIDSTGFRGYLTERIQKFYGFKKPIKVFGGGADNACAALGAGIISEGIGMCSIGTSGVFLSYETNAQKNYYGKLHLFNHVLANRYYSMGVTLAAGDSLNWFKKTFAAEISFGELLKEINTVVPGSDGLIFTPYIVGERTPYFDSQIRGSFIGIDRHHELKHFARSVLEGITFSLKDSQKLMESVAGKKFKKIISVGGGAKNSNWLQMQADIFNTTIVTLKSEQGPALGAAILAAVGCGWFNSLEESINTFVSYGVQYQPEEKNVARYQEIYEIYQQIYPMTANLIGK